MTDSPTNLPEISVSELSGAIKRTVEDAFGFVRVRGEISGFRGASPSGHVYFRLKDANAVIEAVIWKGVYGRLRIKPQEGLEVIATGKVTTFPGSSKYQIVIESLEPAGVGALMALLEERRQKLLAEGLFDASRKKPLPYLPQVIGVVTSPTGAVIRDILHRLADRFPRQVLVWPVRVQGEGSAEEVARAIHGFNAIDEDSDLPRPDVIIVARGGGSLEDLWGFNEEVVVRAAAASRIPLISAVGHETDTTLIDFAADRRAPTPTAAAEMAVPVRFELIGQVNALARRQNEGMARRFERLRMELQSAARALPDAESLLATMRQRLDVAGERLPNALGANALAHRGRLARLAGRHSPTLIEQRIRLEDQRLGNAGLRRSRALEGMVQRKKERLAVLGSRLEVALQSGVRAARLAGERQRERLTRDQDRLRRAMRVLLERQQGRLDRLGPLLKAMSYQGVLERGFALVRDEADAPIRSAKAIQAGQKLVLQFADGATGAVAGDGGGGEAVRKGGAKPKGPVTDQGSLF